MAWHRLLRLVHFDLHLCFFFPFLLSSVISLLVSGFWVFWAIYIGLGKFFLFAKGPRHAPGVAYVDTR